MSGNTHNDSHVKWGLELPTQKSKKTIFSSIFEKKDSNAHTQIDIFIDRDGLWKPTDMIRNLCVHLYGHGYPLVNTTN